MVLLLGIVSAITLTHQKNPANKYQIPSEQVNIKKEDRIKIIKDKEGDL